MNSEPAKRPSDVESHPLVAAFVEDIIAVCKRHGFSIGHEDGQGAFEIGIFSESDAEWLRQANVLRDARSRT